MHSDEVNEIFNGLMLFRSQLQQPTKDANNPFFKQGYVTLEGVMKSIDQGLKGTGLSYSQVVANDENGNVGVKTILTHKSGQYLETGLLSLKPEKSNPQGYGSAITYAKRYQLSALFGISSDKDDDGNQASPSNKPHQTYQKQQAPRQQQSATSGQKAEYDNLLKQAATKLNASTEEVQKSLINITKQKPEYINADKLGKQNIMIGELKNMLQSKG